MMDWRDAGGEGYMEKDKHIKIYGELHSIDYRVLISHIQAPHEKRKPVPHWLVKLLGKLLFSHISGFLRLFVPKSEIHEFLEAYGVSFSKLELKGISLIDKTPSEQNMLNISVSIDSVDWDVLSDKLSDISSIGNELAAGDSAEKTRQLVEILKPFINDTMATIPPSAIVQLFDLLGKDKLVELAKSCGVVVSDVLIETLN